MGSFISACPFVWQLTHLFRFCSCPVSDDCREVVFINLAILYLSKLLQKWEHSHFQSRYKITVTCVIIFYCFKYQLATSASKHLHQKVIIVQLWISNTFFYHTLLFWLTAKCGSKSTRSVSANPEISSARGRWSTTAWRGTPLPLPLDPLPLALRAPRPRAWTPRPRPGVNSPRLAACVKTKVRKEKSHLEQQSASWSLQMLQPFSNKIMKSWFVESK